MEIYRRANVYERVLSLYVSSLSTGSTKKKIQHLVYRAAQVGGSTTLITRAGILHWIQCQIGVANTKEAGVLKEIARELYDTCDQERVDRWSHGGAIELVQDIQSLVP